MKTEILAAIGEKDLQPAAALNAALAANDRVKYAFSLLQMAVAHAEHPEQPAAALKQERIACGIDDVDLDASVADARMVEKSCRVVGAARILKRLVEDMRLMAAPVLAAKREGVARAARGIAERTSHSGGRSRRSQRHFRDDAGRAWQDGQPASPCDGFAQAAQRDASGAGRGERGRRRRL